MGGDFEIREGPESLRIDLASMLGLAPKSWTPVLEIVGPNRPQRAPASWPRGVDRSPNRDAGFYALERTGQRRRLLMFHDSFFVAPLFSPESQPLATHFERSYFVRVEATDGVLERFVDMVHPDIVVEERAERYLRMPPLPPVPLDAVTPQLRRLDGMPAFFIDAINDGRAKNDQAITAGELTAIGWALDGRRPAQGVEIMIGGIPYPASYGFERPDVADTFKCSCTQSGFRADFSVERLSPGSHTVSVRVISADGASYTEAVWGKIRIVK
jgi:hypothetical protein